MNLIAIHISHRLQPKIHFLFERAAYLPISDSLPNVELVVAIGFKKQHFL